LTSSGISPSRPILDEVVVLDVVDDDPAFEPPPELRREELAQLSRPGPA